MSPVQNPRARKGINPNDIALEQYNPEWAQQFENDRQFLAQFFADDVNLDWAEHPPVIEHIGSTAIPGVVSKGGIDIAVGLQSPSHVYDGAMNLLEMGYKFRKQYPGKIHAMLLNEEGECVNTVHLMGEETSEYQMLVNFRDYLRSNPDALERYNEAKISAVESAQHADKPLKEYQGQKKDIATQLNEEAQETLGVISDTIRDKIFEDAFSNLYRILAEYEADRIKPVGEAESPADIEIG